MADHIRKCLGGMSYFGLVRGVSSFFDCGFDATSSVAGLGAALRYYGEKRGKAPDIAFTFRPVHGGEAFQVARYDRIKKGIAQGLGATFGDQDWIAYYSAANDMRVQDAKWAQYAAEWKAAGVQIAQQRHNLYVSDLTARWNRLFGKADLSAQDKGSLEYVSAALGGSHLDSFVGKYGLTTRFALDVLCKQDAALCAAQTPRVQQAEAAAAAARASAASAGAYAGAQPSSGTGLLSVRTYDSGGNYTGTTSMTALEAEILGVKPY
jgi:hypothetical protein